MNYRLRYTHEACDSVEGWEEASLPIGNGYFGANIFGIVSRDRVQVTENSLQNPGPLGGLNSFADLYLNFDHALADVEDYERRLDIEKSQAVTSYRYQNTDYKRTYITSYPDRCLAIHLEASKKASITVKVEAIIPYVKPYAVEPGDGGGKVGSIEYDGQSIILSGRMIYYDIKYYGEISIRHNGGVCRCDEDGLLIENADDVTVIMSVATNYRLDAHVFREINPKKKVIGINPSRTVAKVMDALRNDTFESLKKRHESDYRHLFDRVSLEIDTENESMLKTMTTNELLNYKKKVDVIPYLDVLLFHYGRYLLISSSRKGALPPNLQGTWNVHDQSPWGSGYWHNINIQMNYWPAFVTNLHELFEPYVDFFQAFLPMAQSFASAYIQNNYPHNYENGDGNCGWTIGTAVYPYTISEPGVHSGPGTGPLTTKLFWDYYDFTRDPDILDKVTYPVIEGMSRFLTKTVDEYDGEYLTTFSASPEQMLNRSYITDGNYYLTIGSAFDQQMIQENGMDFIEACKILGRFDDAYEVQLHQSGKYHPVEVGLSGQIKEYMEEGFYGEIGEYDHRHISQLCALFPGTQINNETPAWEDASRYTLHERGYKGPGWGLAFRMLMWARLREGEKAYKLLSELISENIMGNLWDAHPPYQIDGNFGLTAGVAEMLIQSHQGFIELIPALPEAWVSGSVKGLKGRGNYTVDIRWEKHRVISAAVNTSVSGLCKVYCKGLVSVVITDSDGNDIQLNANDSGLISFEVKANMTYSMKNLVHMEILQAVEEFSVDKKLNLCWRQENGCKYRLERAVDSEARYTTLEDGYEGGGYQDKTIDLKTCKQIRYRLIATADGKEDSQGVSAVINNATELEKARYRVNVGLTKWHYTDAERD